MLVTPVTSRLLNWNARSCRPVWTPCAAADDIAGKLEGLVLPIVMRVGDNDKLYGSVTTAIIGDALTAQASKWIVAASCSTIPSVPSAITLSACVCMPTSSPLPHREGCLRRQGAPR